MSIGLDLYLIELFKEICMKQNITSVLLNKHQDSRLQCQERAGMYNLNRHKTVNDFWKKVIYSEECKVELGMDNCVLTWRRSGKE